MKLQNNPWIYRELVPVEKGRLWNLVSTFFHILRTSVLEAMTQNQNQFHHQQHWKPRNPATQCNCRPISSPGQGTNQSYPFPLKTKTIKNSFANKNLSTEMKVAGFGTLLKRVRNLYNVREQSCWQHLLFQ